MLADEELRKTRNTRKEKIENDSLRHSAPSLGLNSTRSPSVVGDEVTRRIPWIASFGISIWRALMDKGMEGQGNDLDPMKKLPLILCLLKSAI